MTSIFAIGATGLVGSQLVSKAIECSEVKELVTLTRRDYEREDKKLNKIIINNDNNQWYDIIKNTREIPIGSTFFSSFGTTRKLAGSAENFVKIDHDINFSSFQSAKENGNFTTAIIVSSMGSNKDSNFLYMKTKGQLEEDIINLKFKRTIILKPGILLGERSVSKGINNTIAEKIGSFFRGTFLNSTIGYPVYGEEVAKCAIKLSLRPINEEIDNEIIYVNSDEIIKIANN